MGLDRAVRPLLWGHLHEAKIGQAFHGAGKVGPHRIPTAGHANDENQLFGLGLATTHR